MELHLFLEYGFLMVFQKNHILISLKEHDQKSYFSHT